MEEHELKLPAIEENYVGEHELSKSPIRYNEESSIKSNALGSLMFRLNFDLGEGNSAKINVSEGDNFYRLAHSFAGSHGLGEEAITKVYNLLEHTFRVHRDK